METRDSRRTNKLDKSGISGTLGLFVLSVCLPAFFKLIAVFQYLVSNPSRIRVYLFHFFLDDWEQPLNSFFVLRWGWMCVEQSRELAWTSANWTSIKGLSLQVLKTKCILNQCESQQDKLLLIFWNITFSFENFEDFLTRCFDYNSVSDYCPNTGIQKMGALRDTSQL